MSADAPTMSGLLKASKTNALSFNPFKKAQCEAAAAKASG